MNILLLGSGGREHALAWKIAQSSLCEALYIAPGNAGTALIASNTQLDPNDFSAVSAFIAERSIDMLVVGPEEPLVKGIRDYLENKPEHRSLLILGPGRDGARLEGSKEYAKAFMNRHGIPTARYRAFHKTQRDEAMAYLDTHPLPVVLKADGLAAGKGVIICNSIQEARDSLDLMMLKEAFGSAGDMVVVEEFLDGIELSVFILTDGRDYLLLPEAKDYKRIGEQDSGPNTGGMGSVSPVPFARGAFMEKVEKGIIMPTVRGLAEEKIPFLGFIFFGLIKVGEHPFVIEYNVRMGDPESQSVIPRIESDLVELLRAAARGNISGSSLVLSPDYTAAVVMSAGGYPGYYTKGHEIAGLNTPTPECIVFHAGTAERKGRITSNGGRVLAVTGRGKTLQDAMRTAYDGVFGISWEGHYFRRDIGRDLMG